jgi:O-antigen biosynthesis protein
MAASTNSPIGHFQRRTRQVRNELRSGGVRQLTASTLSKLARKIDRPSLMMGVRDDDLLAVDLSRPAEFVWSPHSASDLLDISWVMTAPDEGSGGHTTMFRLIRHLQGLGHRNRVYFYDVFGGDFDHHRDVVHRSYADPTVPVFDYFDGLHDADAIFATSWETAYAVYNSRAQGKRFYLVQDLESMFYPAGSAAVFADDTYRMGFHGITAGPWLAEHLQSEYGMDSDWFPFGCDTERYSLAGRERSGVVFYARPQAARRAYELGVLSLALFHRSHPDVTIHCYGNKIGAQAFPVVDHGLVSPATLNEIYNDCFAGLSLSMTNVSLVPHEMLAAGCIPVVNDARHNRVVLNNSHVRYVQPRPHDLARGLAGVVDEPAFSSIALAASASVESIPWERAGEAADRAIRRVLSR